MFAGITTSSWQSWDHDPRLLRPAQASMPPLTLCPVLTTASLPRQSNVLGFQVSRLTGRPACCFSSKPEAKVPKSTQLLMLLEGLLPFLRAISALFYLFLTILVVTWTRNEYHLHLHVFRGGKVESTCHCFKFHLCKPRVKPDSDFSLPQ